MTNDEKTEVYKLIKEYSSDLNYGINETAIVLAAGHGKRIKSQKSKMLHKIWGVPTVERVFNACRNGNHNMNIIVVVGIKAEDVVQVLGKRDSTVFSYQEAQNGTGHAVQVALDKIDKKSFDGIVYVLPGDMGLIDAPTLKQFKEEFIQSESDMMVLTGIYEGNPAKNSYGRIIRVKETDETGKSSGGDAGKVIQIMEHKDILALPEKEPYKIRYNKKTYSYTRKELIENNEFNSGVYAFNYKKLEELVHSISTNNAQNEIYITDLIDIFNKKGYSVSAVSPKEQYVVMGFNNKSVLKEMEDVAREKVYDKLKDIIVIDDPEDFFIDENIVNEILEMDGKNVPLDIKIGKGVYIGRNAKLNYNLELMKNVYIDGNIVFGTNVTIHENVHLSTMPRQNMYIGNSVEILYNNIIKGNIIIGEGSRIESGVNMTGSDEFPLRVGKNVLIKGASYIFGSIVDNDVHIERSVIIRKHLKRILKKDGSVQAVKFYMPPAEGMDTVNDI